MSDAVFSRRKGESKARWIMRLHLDPWFEGATAAELADFTGLGVEAVEQAIKKWCSSAAVRRIHQHAAAIAERIGWQGSEAGLIHLALERYAQRFHDREVMPRGSIEDDIADFCARTISAAEALACASQSESAPLARSYGKS